MSQPARSARAILQSTPLFAALTEAELSALATRTGLRSFSPGQLLFNEGDPCVGLYILVTGRVRIFKMSVAGREHVLAIEGPGSSVAELPVFDGGNYPASASAVDATEAIFLSRADLRALCLEHPEVSLKLLQVVGARLRRLVGIIEELSFTTVRHRLISWLLRQSQAHGRTFTLATSHQEIAAEIGTVRELVSRNLSRLQAQGLIATNGREITIPDPAALEADLSTIL